MEALRILIVDDDEVDRLVARRALLRGLGDGNGSAPTIVDVSGGAAALATLRDDPNFSLVMLDHEMPGMDGVATVRAIRAAGLLLPVLVTTGREDGILAELMAAGATDYLQKVDLTPENVRRRIHHMLRLARAEAHAEATRVELAREHERLEAIRDQLARSVASRDEMLAIVSHDLRNPLHAVTLAIDELADPALDPELRARYIGAIRRSLGRAGKLISDLLDVSRLDADGLTLARQPISVRDVIEGTVRDQAMALREAGMTARVTLAPELAELVLEIDPQRTGQALANLLGNAIKYARGTEIIDVIGRRAGPDIELVVADRGPGIEPANLPFLFDRFYQAETRRRAGAGLGLAIVRGIARAHGGDVTAHVREGGGAEFRYRIPG